jgi:hypothetical protein
MHWHCYHWCRQIDQLLLDVILSDCSASSVPLNGSQLQHKRRENMISAWMCKVGLLCACCRHQIKHTSSIRCSGNGHASAHSWQLACRAASLASVIVVSISRR